MIYKTLAQKTKDQPTWPHNCLKIISEKCRNRDKIDTRDGPFNFQGVGLCCFFLKKYSDSQCCWKNILILVEEKKINWFRVFVIQYNVKFWKKNSCIARQKKILTLCVVRKKNSEQNKIPYPPFKLNGRPLTTETNGNVPNLELNQSNFKLRYIWRKHSKNAEYTKNRQITWPRWTTPESP